ncbi:methyltransferase domain-containing protein [Candidatus Woesearchaeota archaeon]|nr:methyltransferase domain-containing protein [Candidatus Woesearchaeota archaeon]
MKPVKDKENIRGYWEGKLPQRWYSQKEAGTKEYYDEVERVRFTTQYPFLLSDAEFNRHAGEKILEVGCGIGTDSLMFAKHGAAVYGVDLTQNAIETTAKRFKLYGLRGHFKRMDAEHLEFPDNTFDFAYSFGVLHHTPDTRKAINEVHRALKPGKSAVIMLYARGWMYYLFFPLWHGILRGEFFRLSWSEIVHKHYEVEGNVPLVRVYTKAGIKRLFTQFSRVKVWRRPLINSLGDKFPNKWLVRQLEKIWGGSWMIKAWK